MHPILDACVKYDSSINPPQIWRTYCDIIQRRKLFTRLPPSRGKNKKTNGNVTAQLTLRKSGKPTNGDVIQCRKLPTGLHPHSALSSFRK